MIKLVKSTQTIITRIKLQTFSWPPHDYCLSSFVYIRLKFAFVLPKNDRKKTSKLEKQSKT